MQALPRSDALGLAAHLSEAPSEQLNVGDETTPRAMNPEKGTICAEKLRNRERR